MRDLFAEFIGECEAVRRVREACRRLIADEQPDSPAPSVLIRGPRGTGKSLLAWLIHRSGPRADGPFITFDCETISPPLLPIELYGFAPGPCPDRYPRGMRGLIEAAHGGTLFLNCIELIPLDLQTTFETVIETNKEARIGGIERRDVNVRIISATCTMPGQLNHGGFRRELYRRLAEITFDLPRLEERDRDVILIAERLLERTCRAFGVPMKVLAPDAEVRILRTFWLGDLHQLAEALERVVSLTGDAIVTAEMLVTAGLPERQA